MKFDVSLGVIAIVSVVSCAHWFGKGVNVYVVVTELFGAGDQDPLMPFCDVVASAGMEAPSQYGPGLINSGLKAAATETLKLVVVAQNPALGVKV